MNYPASLETHEWMAVMAIIVVMLTLTVFAAFKNRGYNALPFSHTSAYTQNRVEATLKGAVVHPGTYSLPKTMTLKELLEIAELTEDADVRRFNLQRTVQQGRAIHVPSRPMITVHINGAVAPVSLKVPQGTRVEELIDLVVLDDDADARVLKKKRKIKDGEAIHISKRKR